MLERLAALAQALTYLAVVLAAGGVFARASLRPQGEATRLLLRVTRTGALATIGATAAALVVLMLRLGNEFDVEILGVVLASNVGGAAALRLTGACLLLATPSDDEDAFGRGMQLSAAALIAGSFAFSGHAAVEGLWSGMLAAVHVAVIAWWVGALLVLRRACALGDDVRTLLRRFSKLALGAIGALVAAGVILVLTLIDFTEGFTPYVRNLAAKLAIVAIVLGLAAYNRFVLTRDIEAGDATAITRLARAIEVELGLIGAVLVVTSIMTTFTSPHE
jgi:putative copper export protein